VRNSIDLNADIGEGSNTDPSLLKVITSASIACGGHAGDEDTMHRCVRLAKKNKVVIGAHPGFPDKENFGRRRLDMPHDEIAEAVVEQITRLVKIGWEEGAAVRYIKLHGALSTMVSEHDDLAKTVYEAVHGSYPSLAVLTIDNSAQMRAAEVLGMKVVREAYADRAYDRHGALVPRGEEGAVLTRRSDVLTRCLLLAKRGEIVSREGRVLETKARALCLHGDTPGAPIMAHEVRAALEDEGITVASAFT
jgi:UPF0271 protein